MSIGTALCPGVGTAVGGVVGGLIGGIGTRFGLGYTPLGSMTEYESREAAEMNPDLAELDVELDTSKSFEEIQELLKKKEIPLKLSSELVNANKVSYSQISKILGNDVINDMLSMASNISPQLRIEGLKQIKKALGC